MSVENFEKPLSGLRINISNLSEGIHHRSLVTDPMDVGLDVRFTNAVQIQATLEKRARQLFLHVDLATAGLFTCDRCLNEHLREVKASYAILYVFGNGALNDLKEEVQYISPEANMIDIGEDVRQYATLVVPQKILCKEECAGLCPTCGINRNRSTCHCVREEIDSRWSGLPRKDFYKINK